MLLLYGALLLGTHDGLAGVAADAFRAGVARRHDAELARPYFAEAAARYEELRRQGAGSAALFRNQGNAYRLAGDLPRALLAYHRGLRVAPADADLRQLLADARAEVALPNSGLGRPPVDDRPPWLPRLASWPILTGAWVLWALGCGAWTRWLMTRRRGLRTAGTVALGLATLLLAGYAWDARRLQDERDRPLVIVAVEGARLRTGDGAYYPPRVDTPLARGTEARQLAARGDWLRVVLAGGEDGWLHRSWLVSDDVGDGPAALAR